MLKRIFFLMVGAALLNACDATGSTGVQVEIPEIEFDCDEPKCQIGGAPPATVYIVLSGCSPDQIPFDLIATSSMTTTCNGTGCTATSTGAWTDTNGDPIEMIESSNYYVCGWIDLDSDLQFDGSDGTTDAFSASRQFISESRITLTDWSQTYVFVRKIFQNR